MLKKVLNVKNSIHKVRVKYRRHNNISRVSNRMFYRSFNPYNQKLVI